MTSYTKKYKTAITICIAIGILMLSGVLSYIFTCCIPQSCWNPSVTVEAGTKYADISAAAFMKNSKNKKADFVTDISALPLDTAGEYPIEVKAYGIKHSATLIVEDTTPPTAETKDVLSWNNKIPQAEEFVTGIQDYSTVTLSFKSAPLTDKEKQTVTIALTDACGNSSEVSAVLTLINDTESPHMIGVEDKLIYIGDKVLYKNGVTITDNCDKAPDLTVDTHTVNSTAEGTYTVTFTASDAAGNATMQKANFTFRKKSKTYVNEETMYAQAKKIAVSILNDKMTKKEKVQAVFYWVTNQVAYEGIKTGDDWVKSAYDGFKECNGDCFVISSVSRALLTLADVDNIVIVNKNGGHYWNMVNCGDGWYHFDATPFRWGGKFCMVTDEELLRASRAHHNSHLWDTQKYPETPKE